MYKKDMGSGSLVLPKMRRRNEDN